MSTVDDDVAITTEVALFFQRNPFTIESPEGLARKLGRKTEAVRRALDTLASKQLVLCEGDGRAYAYAQPYIADQV